METNPQRFIEAVSLIKYVRSTLSSYLNVFEHSGSSGQINYDVSVLSSLDSVYVRIKNLQE